MGVGDKSYDGERSSLWPCMKTKLIESGRMSSNPKGKKKILYAVVTRNDGLFQLLEV